MQIYAWPEYKCFYCLFPIIISIDRMPGLTGVGRLTNVGHCILAMKVEMYATVGSELLGHLGMC